MEISIQLGLGVALNAALSCFVFVCLSCLCVSVCLFYPPMSSSVLYCRFVFVFNEIKWNQIICFVFKGSRLQLTRVTGDTDEL